MKRSAQPLPIGRSTRPIRRAARPAGAGRGGLADKGRRAPDAEELDLGLKVVADVLASVVVTKGKTAGHVLGKGAEALAHGLPHRLERLEAIGTMAGMNADALRRAVIDGDEHRGLTLARHDRGQVGAPHRVNSVGGDAAIVSLRSMRRAHTLRRQQDMLAHQPHDAAAAGALALDV